MPTIIEGIAEKLSDKGGVLRHKGKAYFVPFSCPEDEIKAEIVCEQKHEARLIDIIKESPYRVEPRCKHFGICGGCAFQHISYEKQLFEKKLMLEDALKRIGQFTDLPEIKIIQSAPYNYRNRVELHCGKNSAGYKKLKSAEIISISECPIAVPVINSYIKAKIKNSLPRFTIYGYGEKIAVEGSAECEKLFIDDLGISMDTSVFFQSNLELQKKMLCEIKENAGNGKNALDIYSGAGVFSFFIADSFEKITLVEENQKAIAIARENLKHKTCDKEFIAFSAEKYAASCKNSVPPQFDLVIADPPREGLSLSLVQLLLNSAPKTFIYVSCNPASFARDLKLLSANKKITLESITFYDFYPQTPHIEITAVLKSIF